MSSKITREFLRNVQKCAKAITAWALKMHSEQLDVDKHVSFSYAASATSYARSLRVQLALAEQDEDDLYKAHWAKCKEVAAERRQFGIGE